jgi:hypothetical protein
VSPARVVPMTSSTRRWSTMTGRPSERGQPTRAGDCHRQATD